MYQGQSEKSQKHYRDKKNRKILTLLVLTAITLVAVTSSLIIYQLDNPVLNSPEDLTDFWVKRIAENRIKTLTINYEFTRCLFTDSDDDAEKEEKYKEYHDFISKNHPFVRAVWMNPDITDFNFEIILGPNVTSLDCAFAGFSKMNHINIRDTSGITSMNAVFANAKSFNQPLDDWIHQMSPTCRECFSRPRISTAELTPGIPLP